MLRATVPAWSRLPHSAPAGAPGHLRGWEQRQWLVAGFVMAAGGHYGAVASPVGIQRWWLSVGRTVTPAQAHVGGLCHVAGSWESMGV